MRLSRLANALLFYTDAEVERFHTDGWSHTGVVGALNNGVDVTEIQRWRTPFDSAARGRNLLFIGRVTEKSQLHLAIEALRSPLLKATHLHIIGSGSEEAALQLQARALGVSDRLSWHGPITDERKISEIANLCSAFVYPGSVGLSLIHGMAYGLPCVVHDNPLRHMPEISAFEDGKSGAAMSENDSASVARVVHSLLENPSEANAMSMYNRKKVDHSYNTKVMADRFIDFERHIAGL